MLRTGKERRRDRGWRRTKERKMGTVTGVETRGRTRAGNKSNSEYGDGDEYKHGDGNADGIWEGRGEAQNRKKSHQRCRRHVGNGRYLGGKRKQRRQEGVGSVATNPDNLDNRKEARGEAEVFCLYLICSRWASMCYVAILPVALRIFPSLPGPRLGNNYRDAS